MVLDNPTFVTTTPVIVKWEITKACNLACKHCYARGGTPSKDELSTDEVKKFMKRFADLNVFTLQFTGGEPFIRKDFMELLRFAHELNFSIDILTNGTLINKEVAKKIASLNVHSVQVSLDGANPDTHDRFRGIPGAFQRTILAIKSLVKSKVRVSVATTFNRTNVNELDEIYQLVRDLGVCSFLFGFVYPIGRGEEVHRDLALSPEEQELVREFLIRESQKIKQTDGFSIYIDEAIGKIINGKVRPPVCKAGRIMVAITAEGNVALCPMLSELSAGNLRNQDIQDLWEKSPLFLYIRNIRNIKGYCSACKYLDVCGGGCKAMAFFKTGDPMGSDPHCPYIFSTYKKGINSQL